jgi:hypothetical protein
MNLESVRELFRQQLVSARIAAPGRTGLYHTASDNLAMASAYLHDGDVFLQSGDHVNALASFCYGLGWLHCGAATGLLVVDSPSCPFSSGMIEPLPANVREKLIEKTIRYSGILAAARAASRPAPEKETAPYETADRVQVVLLFYAVTGDRFLSRGAHETALACISYGHGWLDAGVRGGLFVVESDHHLFAL